MKVAGKTNTRIEGELHQTYIINTTLLILAPHAREQVVLQSLIVVVRPSIVLVPPHIGRRPPPVGLRRDGTPAPNLGGKTTVTTLTVVHVVVDCEKGSVV